MADHIDTGTTEVAVARAIAVLAHRGQTDKAGKPYIEHPTRVARTLERRKYSADVVAGGWLHDVLEDTDLTRDDLHAAGVTWPVILYVEAVTRVADEPPETYYQRVLATSGAYAIKQADIEDNTNPARLALLDDATIVRLTRKYAKARAALGMPS
jgi:(p)ppGpp synthase/HD superfamily hydrolase